MELSQQPQNPGQSPAVQAALQRRAGAPGQLDQVSQQAPMQNPVPQMSNPSDANKSSAPQIQPKQKWEPETQADFALSAIVEQLKNTNKLEMEKMKMAQQPSIPQPSMGTMPAAQTQPPAQPPAMPMGGGGSNMFSPSSDSKTNYFDISSPSMFNQNQSNGSKQNKYGF